MKLKAIDISVFLTLIICIIATVSFENDCKGIREEVLRLHVIANSDEDYDQELKLKVRDAVLKSGEAVFSGSEDILPLLKGEVDLPQAKTEGFQRQVPSATRRRDYPVSINLLLCHSERVQPVKNLSV